MFVLFFYKTNIRGASKRHLRRIFKKERILDSTKLTPYNVANSEPNSPSVDLPSTSHPISQFNIFDNISGEKCEERKTKLVHVCIHM